MNAAPGCRLTIGALAIGALLSVSCSAANLGTSRSGDTETAPPPLRVPSPIGEGFGVQVQPWYLQPDDLAQIEAAGFRVVRWGIAWDKIERARGVYDWSEVDRFVGRLRATRLHSVVILGFGNALYAGGARPSGAQRVEPRAPASPDSRLAFIRFAAAAAARYRGEPIAWEIWNEPDSAAFWAPRPDPAAYAALAGQACRAIKAAAPGAEVLGGAGAAMPNAVADHAGNLYAALARSPARSCIDAVSSHAYRMGFDYDEPHPESIEDDDRASRGALYGALKFPARMRFVITEWGFPTSKVTADLQAAYLIRANLVNAAAGVPLTVWYEWRDSRADESDPESRFGLLGLSGGPKSMHRAFEVFSRISGATFARRLATSRGDVRAYLIERDERYFVVAWRRTADAALRSRLSIDGTYRADVSFMPQLLPVGAHEKLLISVE